MIVIQNDVIYEDVKTMSIVGSFVYLGFEDGKWAKLDASLGTIEIK